MTVIVPINEVFLSYKNEKISTVDKILNLLTDNSMRLSEISNALGYKSVPGSLKKALVKMLKEGTIELIDKKYSLKIHR